MHNGLNYSAKFTVPFFLPKGNPLQAIFSTFFEKVFNRWGDSRYALRCSQLIIRSKLIANSRKLDSKE